MRSWRRYALMVIFLIALVVLWVSVGDLLGAFLSLIVLTLAGALLFAVSAYFVMNAPAWLRRIRGISWSDHLASLEAEGKAVREHYRMHRAVTFEDLTTGCLVHLVELDDGRLLCLYGQDYYEFEPIDDDPEMNQPRRFPTTEFSLLRHQRTGEVLELIPGKHVVATTLCEPIVKHKTIYDLGITLKDGELISSVSFEVAQRAVQAGAAPAKKKAARTAAS